RVLQDAWFDRLPQPTGAEDRVDRAHVMPVAAFDRFAGLQIDAERGAEERLLDVMHGQRVAGEQHVDVAAPNQLAEIRPAAGVDDHGAGDDGDAIAGVFRLAHHRGNSRDADLDAPFGRDLVRHEREPEAIARLELRDDFDAVNPADDSVAAPDLAQLAAHGPGRLHAARFHLLTLRFGGPVGAHACLD